MTTTPAATAELTSGRHGTSDDTEADVARKTNDDDLMLNMQQVADQLGISYKGVQRLRDRGRLPDPDDEFMGHPLWRKKTIVDFDATRPRRGYNVAFHAGRAGGPGKKRAPKAEP